MLDILQGIARQKVREVARLREECPPAELEQSPLFLRKPHSLVQGLRAENASGVIAEFKRRSPSKPKINLTADPATVVSGYSAAGASGISVLTDELFFGGSKAHLSAARKVTDLPILRKDFIIDPYQVLEAKAMGADLILLIAAILTPKETVALTQKAHELGMEVLLEIHEDADLSHLEAEVDLVGINNRNLRTFKVEISHSMALAKHLPEHLPRISESGLRDPEVVKKLRKAGFSGFLIGENFMKTKDPGAACQDFIRAIQD